MDSATAGRINDWLKGPPQPFNPLQALGALAQPIEQWDSEYLFRLKAYRSGIEAMAPVVSLTSFHPDLRVCANSMAEAMESVTEALDRRIPVVEAQLDLRHQVARSGVAYG